MPSARHPITAISQAIRTTVNPSTTMQPVIVPSVSELSQLLVPSILNHDAVDSSLFPEFDSFFNNTLSDDNASFQLPTVQPITLQSRSTSGIIIAPFYARRKRVLSVPHHVVRNWHSLNIALPTDEPIDSGFQVNWVPFSI